MTSQALFRRFPLVSLAAFALTCSAQVAGAPGSFPETPGASQRAPQTPGPMPVSSGHPTIPPAGTAAPVPSRPAYATSPLLDTPAKPAEITLNQGKLSIKADNSSLTDILHHLAKDTGMTIDGLARDQRIFGVYGPGTPREILSELLDGAGYNVLMLGDTDSGAPRELQLSARSNSPAVAGQPTMAAQEQPQEDDQDDNAPPPPNYPPAGEVAPHAPVVTPGQAPPPNGGVKSPQELLQELQRMRQQQQQQQQQPQ